MGSKESETLDFTTFKDPGIDGRIILNWIVKKWDGGGGHGLDLSGSG